MTVLVTGGSGFIGSRLVRSLVRKGQRVKVLLRPASAEARLGGLTVERAIGDLEDPVSLRKAVEGASSVCHLAGEGGRLAQSRERLFRVNVEGTSNLLQACKEAEVERFVHVSSAVTFGPTTPDRPLKEEDPTPVSPASPYVESKRRGEAVALTFAGEGLPVVVINPSLVIGPEPHRGPVANAIRGRPRWVMPGGTNVVDLDDLVFCLEAALNKGEVGKRYLVGAFNLSWMELYEKLDALLEVRSRRRLVPEGLLHLVAWVGCRWPCLLPSPHSLHWEDIRQGRTTWHFDTSLAKRVFNWDPRPLELTLENALSILKASPFPAP